MHVNGILLMVVIALQKKITLSRISVPYWWHCQQFSLELIPTKETVPMKTLNGLLCGLFRSKRILILERDVANDFFVIVNVSTTNKNELTFTVLKWRQNSQRWISHNFFSYLTHFFSKWLVLLLIIFGTRATLTTLRLPPNNVSLLTASQRQAVATWDFKGTKII